MENFFTRYKNPLVLMAVLFIQVVALATQVKRQENGRAAGGGTRLIRVWTVTAFTPVEKMFVSTGHFFRNGWHDYADLRDVRKQNQQLQDEVSRLQMEQVRLKQDADQAHRLQALLEFKEKYVGKTVAAQVIATSGVEQSRVITIDKGSRNARIKTDMAVITPDGIVGKIKDVFDFSSQVLLINDHDSGAGVILESTRLQGILKGSPSGQLQINDVMSDEKVDAGEHVITSGGDRIFPKGLSVGTVISSSPDRDNDPFLSIRVKPTADLNRLEEVLVVTEVAESSPVVSGSTRAADILSQRLPSIPKQDTNAPKTPGATATPAANPSANTSQPKPAGAGVTPGQKPEQKPIASGGTAATNVPSGTNAPSKPAASPAKITAGTSTGGSASSTTIAKPSGSPVQGGQSAATSSKPATKSAGTSQPQSGASNSNGAAAATPPAKPAGSGATTGGSASSTTSAKPSATPVQGGQSAATSSKPTTKPAGTSQSQSGASNSNGAAAATPTPTPKPKATPPKKTNPSGIAPGAFPSTPQQRRPDQPGTQPSPTPTATPGGQR